MAARRSIPEPPSLRERLHRRSEMRKWLEGFPRGPGPRGISHVSTMTGWPVMTLLRGKIVAEEGKIISGKTDGQFLKKAAFPLARTAEVLP